MGTVAYRSALVAEWAMVLSGGTVGLRIYDGLRV